MSEPVHHGTGTVNGFRLSSVRRKSLGPSRRNLIRRLLGRLKNWRRVATRYDRLARNYLAALALVAIAAEWTKRGAYPALGVSGSANKPNEPEVERGWW